MQTQSHVPNRIELERIRENTRRDEQIVVEPDESGPGETFEVIRCSKHGKVGGVWREMIEANDKKVETYNSMVDQILGAPLILKGQDSKMFIQKPSPQSTAPKPIPKMFRMPDIPKYNGTIVPNEHATSYTGSIKGNDLEDDEIESVLLK